MCLLTMSRRTQRVADSVVLRLNTGKIFEANSPADPRQEAAHSTAQRAAALSGLRGAPGLQAPLIASTLP